MSATSQGRNVMVQGRIVWVAGDLFKGKVKTDQNTRQPIIDQKTGQPKIEYGFGLAVPKSVLSQIGAGLPGEIWAAIHEEAMSLYPSRQIPPGFAMKYKDGDGVDQNGVSFAQREGYAGCLVFACTTSIPIKFFRFENGQNFQVNEGIKCGDYVNVQLSIKAHPAVGQGKPGLYLNPNAVQFLGYGKEIINAPSGDQIFGTQTQPLPPGASSTPVAPAGMLVPGGQPPVPQQYTPQQLTQSLPVEPHYGVLPAIHQPQNQMAPQMPGVPQMGNGYAQPAMPAQQGYAGQQMNPTGPTQFGQSAQVSAFPSNGMMPSPAPQQFAPPPMPTVAGSGGGMAGFPVPGGMPQYRQ